MIEDKELLCSEDQTVAIAAGSVASTNYIDLQKAGLGRGEPIKVFCQMTAAFTSDGSATLRVYLQSDSDSGFATNLISHVDTGAVAKATLVAGYRPIDVYLPLNAQRYVRFYYTVGTATATGGTISAGLLMDQQTNKDPVALGLTS